MKFKPFAITDRIKKTKETYMGLTVPSMTDPYHPTKYQNFGSGDRLLTLGYLRGFEKHGDALTNRMRTSYAEAEELYESKPMIYDHELLLGHLYLPEYTEEEQAEYDRLCESFAMSARTRLPKGARKDHICLDFEKLLKKGINGLREEINEKLGELDMTAPNEYPEFDHIKQWEFLNCCLIELDAVSDLARRYSEEALRIAKEKEEPRKSELIKLGNMLKKVPDQPAESFYEALQSVQFFLSTLFGLYPLGRPDRYLYPFYERDIKNGELTEEFAQELIDNFCLYVSDRVFTRAACGFIVGGRDKNGKLTENPLTYMFLTALDHLKLPDPNGALAVCRDTSEELLLYAADILSHGTSHPAFYNDEAITKSLIENYGVAPEDASDYIHSTCAEISVVGKSKAHSTCGYINLPDSLLRVAKSSKFDSFEELYEGFMKEIKRQLDWVFHRYALGILEASRCGNEAIRICALIDDCINRGKSIYEGGERYMFTQPTFVGFGTTVDSLNAVNELVFKEKKLSFDEFLKILESNFVGNEELRLYIINKLPHYGNEDPIADELAARLAASIQKLSKNDLILWDKNMPGTFSYITHATMGTYTGTTFDGRIAGTSLSDGCGPVQGRDLNGPTTMIRSLTSWDQSALLGGMVVNLKLAKSNFDSEKQQNLVALIKTFMERGGIEFQINVVDREILLDAKAHPDNYRDLIVRIGGYSDYFTRLAEVLQNEIIARTEY